MIAFINVISKDNSFNLIFGGAFLKKPIKNVAAIHDLVGVGKAALTNIIPVMSVLNVDVCPIPTVILSTHMGGYGKPAIRKLNGYIDECREHYKQNNVEFDSILVGYLGDRENVIETKNFIKEFKRQNNLVVVDPILGDNGKFYSGFDKEYISEIRCVLGDADIITPNITEACLLTGYEYRDDLKHDDILNICRNLADFGCRNVVITSIPSNEDNIGIAVYNCGELNILYFDRIKGAFHGTGDIFDAVLIGKILNGSDLLSAVKCSADFIRECIKYSLKYDYPEREGVMVESVLYKLRG